MKNILIVEDDKSLLNGLTISLENENYFVYNAPNLYTAKIMFAKHNIHMVILDLNLPDGDGMTLCKAIREESKIPIMMLTARDLEEDEIIGIESGADDYLTKPFSLSILITRIKSLFRRSNQEFYPNTIESNEIVLNLDQAKLYVKKIEVEISAIEFKLIKLFMKNKGQVLLKETILQRVWDDRGVFVDDNTLQVNIRRIRQKIENDPSKPLYIKTVRGMGYIWWH